MEKKKGRPKIAEYIKIICSTCLNEFKRKGSACNYSKSGHLFCSRKCFYKWNNNKLKNEGAKALKQHWKYRKNVSKYLNISLPLHAKKEELDKNLPPGEINRIWDEAQKGIIFRGKLVFPNSDDMFFLDGKWNDVKDIKK